MSRDSDAVLRAHIEAQAALEPAREAGGRAAAYVDAHQDQFAGDWFGGEGNDRWYVVAFAGDPEPHRQALGELTDNLEVVAVKYSLAELEEIKDDVFAVVEAHDECRFSRGGVDVVGNQVRVGVIAMNSGRLRAHLERRFGDRVRLDVVARKAYSPRSAPFSGWLTDETGRELTVTLMRGGGERNHELELTEMPNEVRVRVVLERFNGGRHAVARRTDVIGTLTAPLGDRAVIDAVAGVPRAEGRRYEYVGGDDDE